jgi:hypothetical protein
MGGTPWGAPPSDPSETAWRAGAECPDSAASRASAGSKGIPEGTEQKDGPESVGWQAPVSTPPHSPTDANRGETGPGARLTGDAGALGEAKPASETSEQDGARPTNETVAEDAARWSANETNANDEASWSAIPTNASDEASWPVGEIDGRDLPRPTSEAVSTDAVWPITESETWRPSEGAAGSSTRPNHRTFAEGESRLTNEANAKGDAKPASETLAGDGPWPGYTAVAGNRSWPPLSETLPEDAASRPSADSPSGDINPRRQSPSGQQVRAPAWDAPTVLLFQVGRAGDLTPAQAYRAGRGRSW